MDQSLSVNDNSSFTTRATLLLCFFRSCSLSLRSQNPISTKHSWHVPGDLPGGQVTECTSGASCGGERKSLLVWNKQYPCGPIFGGREGERERYIHVPIHEYTKLLLINHSYIQSISFSRKWPKKCLSSFHTHNSNRVLNGHLFSLYYIPLH